MQLLQVFCVVVGDGARLCTCYTGGTVLLLLVRTPVKRITCCFLCRCLLYRCRLNLRGACPWPQLRCPEERHFKNMKYATIIARPLVVNHHRDWHRSCRDRVSAMESTREPYLSRSKLAQRWLCRIKCTWLYTLPGTLDARIRLDFTASRNGSELQLLVVAQLKGI
jgi:hypothetical protein